jgi:hypothetical protein
VELSPFELRLMVLVDTLNKRYNDRVKFLHSRSPSHSQFSNPFFGYDKTDKLLDYLLFEAYCCYFCLVIFSQENECEWIMFTNGDNMYHAVGSSWVLISYAIRNGSILSPPMH